MEDRLRKLAALVDAGSFTQAARELHISQPALPAAIRKLEHELKVPLIVHGVRPVKTTAAGIFAYQTAKSLAVNLENLQFELAGLTKADITLRIGFIDSVANQLFADDEAINGLGDRVRLSVMVDNSRQLLQAVNRDELDVAFITSQQLSTGSLKVGHLADEPLVLVCRSDLQEIYQAAMGRGHLPRFISYDQYSATRQLVDSALQANDIQARTTTYSTSPEVTLRLVILGQGAAALPFAMVRTHLLDQQLVLLRHEKLAVIGRGITLAQRRDKNLPPSLVRLARQARRSLEALMAEAVASTTRP